MQDRGLFGFLRSLFTFFGTIRLTEYQKMKIIGKMGFFQFFPHAGTVEECPRHFEVLLLFLSLRYGADLSRSRLVKIRYTRPAYATT